MKHFKTDNGHNAYQVTEQTSDSVASLATKFARSIGGKMSPIAIDECSISLNNHCVYIRNDDQHGVYIYSPNSESDYILSRIWDSGEKNESSTLKLNLRLAKIIDFSLILLVLFWWDMFSSPTVALYLSIFYCIALLCVQLILLKRDGRTIGLFAFGFQIVKSGTSHAPSLVEIVMLRYLGYCILYSPLALIFARYDSSKHTFQDHLSQTEIIKSR